MESTKKALKRDKRKVKSIPTSVDGINFKSKLEAYCYLKLKENKIKAKYEGKTFVVLKGFKYKGEKIQKITYTPDFVGKDFIIECKGWANESFPLRWKLFKYMLYSTKANYRVFMPRSPTDIDIVISKLLEKKKDKNVSTGRVKKQIQRYKQYLFKLV